MELTDPTSQRRPSRDRNPTPFVNSELLQAGKTRTKSLVFGAQNKWTGPGVLERFQVCAGCSFSRCRGRGCDSANGKNQL